MPRGRLFLPSLLRRLFNPDFAALLGRKRKACEMLYLLMQLVAACFVGDIFALSASICIASSPNEVQRDFTSI